MGYLQDTDKWLDAQFEALMKEALEYDELKRNIREKILESYRNGLNAREQAAPPRKFERRHSPRRFERKGS